VETTVIRLEAAGFHFTWFRCKPKNSRSPCAACYPSASVARWQKRFSVSYPFDPFSPYLKSC
jgi:hypothetical protein